MVLILVAILAGGLAAYLATRGGSQPPAPVAQVAAPQQHSSAKVLIATTDIGVGDRLTASDLQWRDWPADGLSDQYITLASMPDAPKKLVGAVARFPIFKGDPIRDDKLAKTDQGYLSAVLDEGMRGVSVQVSPESGSGGFITPNDHVDIVSTHSGPSGNISETILQNVKVLAIGKQLAQPPASSNGTSNGDGGETSKGFAAPTIATFELDPQRAQILINAAQNGRLSLVLRSVADFSAKQAALAANAAEAIKIIRFGRESSIQSGMPDQNSPASVGNASYVPPAPISTAPATTSDTPAPAPVRPALQ
jgi:pilus assembly protein CpaB